MRTVRSQILFFQAMSDPTRQKILSLLEKVDKMCVNDIVRKTRVSQPTISKHLATLKNAGLVAGRREGQQVFYSLNARNMRSCCTKYFSKFSCCSDLFSSSDSTKGKVDSG
ncbi:MAG TPA: metalloregulator ArsR/SmtB family transcription factor [Anaerolineae bacterium]|nr:metalloregulator ArsR/SmtB family transcription factor [Anaerolineae bacterium]